MCIFNSGARAAQVQAEQTRAEVAQAQAEDRTRVEQDKANLDEGKASINSAFAPFDDNYFGKVRQNYVDYAKPQLEDQYAKAQKEMTYALARKSLGNSTIAGDKFSDLRSQYDRNLLDINSTANKYSTQSRQDVEANRNDATNQLFATQDKGAAASAAINRAMILQQPQQFSPLGNLFSNLTALAATNRIASDNRPTTAGARLFGSSPSTGSASSYVVA